MTTFGDLSSGVAAAVALLLIVYLSLYPALVAHVIGRGVRAFGPRALWAAPPIWAAGEWARGHVMTGFPWVPLGNSQIDVTPIAQAASLVGVYGLSALVVLGSVALAWIVVGPPGRGRVVPVAAVAALIAGLAWWGAARAEPGRSPARRHADPRRARPGQRRAGPEVGPRLRRQRFIAATWRCRATAVARGATLVDVARVGDAVHLRGASGGRGDAAPRPRDRRPALRRQRPGRARAPSRAIYNSAFLIQPTGSVGGFYRKMHLVLFEPSTCPLESIL